MTFISLFLATAYQHDNIATNLLLGACVNALVPAAITLGIGVLAFGFIPRMSAFFAYGVIVWSFLISILSSGISINHWILDTSVLNQIVLAPAVNPNWATDIIVLLSNFMPDWGAALQPTRFGVTIKYYLLCLFVT